MNDLRKVWINGELVPWQNATVHLMSHGLSRGSAVFEVFGVHEQPSGPAAFRLSDHLERLENTCKLLGMPLAQNREELIRSVSETVRANGIKSGFIKMIGYWKEDAFTTLVPKSMLDLAVFAVPLDTDLEKDLNKPISACVTKWAKLHPKSVPIEAKVAAHYLNGTLARQDANRRGFDVGIMTDTHGFVAEGSIESIFIIRDNTVKTPPLGRILNSISRRSIIEVAGAEGFEVLQEPLSPEDLVNADEMFTSGTPSKVRPVNRFEDRIFDPAPGPISKKLSELMGDITSGKDDRFRHWLEVV